MKHILFICSKNKWRSPTAETIFAEKEGYDVLSAGLNNDSETPLTSSLVEWADTIFVMEKKQRSKLQSKFGKFLNKQQLVCLEIPDNYEYMDLKLINILERKVGKHLKLE